MEAIVFTSKLTPYLCSFLFGWLQYLIDKENSIHALLMDTTNSYQVPQRNLDSGFLRSCTNCTLSMPLQMYTFKYALSSRSVLSAVSCLIDLK